MTPYKLILFYFNKLYGEAYQKNFFPHIMQMMLSLICDLCMITKFDVINFIESNGFSFFIVTLNKNQSPI